MSFDPAAHLAKQGWGGKGTALRHGHATRPIAVVQKKTLAGIGKDRDEAIPFWDHIFASTASAILIPSLSPTPPPTSNGKAGAEEQSQGSQSATPLVVRKLSLLASAKKETARRGLYSRFSRGTTLSLEPTPEAESEGSTTPPSGIASTSKVAISSVKPAQPKSALSMNARGKMRANEGTSVSSVEPEVREVKETKEERRVRKEEKQRKKDEKAGRKAEKAERREAKARRRADGTETVVPSAATALLEGSKGQKRRRVDDATEGGADIKSSKRAKRKGTA